MTSSAALKAANVASLNLADPSLLREQCYIDGKWVGTPSKARAMLKAVADEVPMGALAVHFHDTRGQALANVFACVEEGVRVVDASVSGLGGCPSAPGASGNVATEDVVYLLHGMGFVTGVDLDALVETGQWISNEIGRGNGSKFGRALAATTAIA